MLTQTQIGLLMELSYQIREDLVSLYNYSFFDRDFAGACAVAAWLLRERARDHGIELILAMHSEHCWTETPEGTVVDPTFSQYSYELGIDCEVLVGAPTEAHEAPCRHVAGEEVVRGHEAEGSLVFWPDDQNPLSDWNAPILQGYLRRQLLAA